MTMAIQYTMLETLYDLLHNNGLIFTFISKHYLEIK